MPRNCVPAVFTILILSFGVHSDAWASGRRPDAKDDSATVTRGGVVSVLDSGALSILDNDTDKENDPLTAVLYRDVEHGKLTLESDGTFVYQHNGDSADSDKFEYCAFDGTECSKKKRVTIVILPGDPIPPQIVGQDTVAVDEDSSLTIELNDLMVIDPDSDFPGDFTLEVNDGENYFRQDSVITPFPDLNGQIIVPVRVFDRSNYSDLFPLVVDVLPQNDAPFTIGTPPDQEAIETVLFELKLSGIFDDIDANETFQFSATGLPPSGSLSIDSVSGVLSGMPIVGDARDAAYNVEIIATDSGGLSATVGFQLTIQPMSRADLELTAALLVNPVTVGETAQWNISIENHGPADLEVGELVAQWTTSGPTLSLAAPQFCSVTIENSRTSIVQCTLDGLAARNSISIDVQGTQDSDGDNSVIAVAVSDDPIFDNNSSLIGAQVVAEFSEGPTQVLDLSGTSVAGGELNGDNAFDLVVSSDQTLIFYNSGNRTVVTPGTSLGPESGGTLALLLDWNGDGLQDIAVAGMTGQAGRIYLNDGSGGFSVNIDLQNNSLGTIASGTTADFDKDGFADLVLTGTNATALIKSEGQSGYSTTLLPAGGGIDASAADINNDTYADIIVVEAGDRSVVLMVNLGDGVNFSTRSLQRGSVASARAADMNGDGDVDLLLAIDGTDLTIPESRVLYQQSDGSFSSGDTIGASSLSMMLAGDVDGDTIPDIIALNQAGVHQIYRGILAGGFTLATEQIVSQGMRHGVLFDFNGDGSLDLIFAGPQAGVVEMHANNGIGRLGLGDRVAPVIELIGDATVTLAAGDLYQDPGATATDDIDGDLTASILVAGSVNTTVIGTYTISYSVADRAGNNHTVQRKINVEVNAGVGGSGGGTITPLSVLILLTLIVMRRLRKLDRPAANRVDTGISV
jgi:VCBS repeat-containing protein